MIKDSVPPRDLKPFEILKQFPKVAQVNWVHYHHLVEIGVVTMMGQVAITSVEEIQLHCHTQQHDTLATWLADGLTTGLDVL